MSVRQISIAFQSDKPARDYGELAATVESYGFGVMSVYGDLMFQPPVIPLTVAAQATQRIRLGPAALNPYTLHPVEIAGQIAALDQFSQGRAYLGLSRGAWLDSLGIDQSQPVSRLVEAVDVVEHLLAGRQAAYQGKHFQLRPHHRLQYAVRRDRVPLLIGSWGRQTLRTAGSRADEVKIGGSANPAVVTLVAGWLREGARQSGRSDVPGIVLGAVTIVDEDRAVARNAIREQMALYLPVVAGLDPTVEVDPELLRSMERLVNQSDVAAAGGLIPDDLIDRFALAGTPDDVILRCEEIFDAGAGRIEFGTPHGTSTATGLRLLGERVLPGLKRLR